MSRCCPITRVFWLSAGLAACAHGFEARSAAFHKLGPSLPACPERQHAIAVGQALATPWAPGDAISVRGHLAVVAYGPPCEGHDAPGSGKHCTVVWTMWDGPPHRREFPDLPPSNHVKLAAQPATGGDRPVLPALVDGSDVQAAEALGDLDVTVSGLLPENLCESENGYPDREERTTKVDCAPLSLGLYPITVTGICRNSAPARPDNKSLSSRR